MSTKDLSYYLSLRYPAEFNEREQGGFFVTHPDLDGCMAEGNDLEEAHENLKVARRLWISARLEGGYPVPEPTPEEDYSGKMLLRMSPSLHARLAHIASRNRISLSLLLNTVLASYAGGAEPLAGLIDELKAEVRTVQDSTPALRPSPVPFPAPPKQQRQRQYFGAESKPIQA